MPSASQSAAASHIASHHVNSTHLLKPFLSQKRAIGIRGKKMNKNLNYLFPSSCEYIFWFFIRCGFFPLLLRSELMFRERDSMQNRSGNSEKHIFLFSPFHQTKNLNSFPPSLFCNNNLCEIIIIMWYFPIKIIASHRGIFIIAHFSSLYCCVVFLFMAASCRGLTITMPFHPTSTYRHPH